MPAASMVVTIRFGGVLNKEPEGQKLASAIFRHAAASPSSLQPDPLVPRGVVHLKMIE